MIAAASIIGNGGHVSVLVRMVESDPMAKHVEIIDPAFRLVPEGHYDGVYFYAIALDPVATGQENYLIDASVYRYGHPGYGWLAGLVTGGSAPAVPYALLGLNLIAFPLAAYLASRLASALGKTPWSGLLVALNPGLLYVLSVDTGEVVTAAVLVGALYAWLRGRVVAAAVLLAFLPFLREVLVLVPIAIGAWEFLRSREPDRVARVLLLGATLVPVVVWWGYLLQAFGEFPVQAYPGSFSAPFVGWADSMMEMVFSSRRDLVSNQLGTFGAPLILSVALVLMVVLIRSLSLRSFLHPVVFALAVVSTTFSTIQVQYPKDLVRLLAVQLALAPVVFTDIAAAPQPTRTRRAPRSGTRALESRP